ncbi:hypothetical protein HHK36_023084 [Tetracentron sinense]|uniref:YTH domain-containing family protein n=1 Tax=Tetracentron sinense TaxID=13715 RepID=A0A834YR71_TETSI|nr:hypothetical protein HHK36_023084 [Tetracentron sinense]
MEMYNISEHGNSETYLIQDTEPNPYLTNPPLEQIEVMDYEGAPEFVVDQGLYYPTSTNYGYYGTGFELPAEWDDHHRFFGLDGPDLQYAGLQTESLPYVYYTPSYGYAHSPYNPYNPYIPGAIMGVDGPFVGTQQYYSGPTYQNPVSSPSYFPIVVQSRPDIIPNSSLDPMLLNASAPYANRPDGPGLKYPPSSSSAGTIMVPPRSAMGNMRAKPMDSASNHIHYSAKISEGSKASAALIKEPAIHGRVTSGSVPHSSSSSVTQGRGASGSIQYTDQFSIGRVSSTRNPLKVALPVTNGLSDFGSNSRGWAAVDKLRPRFNYNGVLNTGNGGPDVLGEQNRGPRSNRSKSQSVPSISVKSYKTMAGASNAKGSIIIYANQYNKEDFPVDYANAKFFVIKSYSEDDVHKSIKYNVWSSTPNGNKRLDGAYEDAQRIAGGKLRLCPVFLFFSVSILCTWLDWKILFMQVNTSGQFCGVSEMIGPVDFHMDMNFWQQDKWSGSFPVKWHIIKDVPNTNFRHIILENNENKPVTNSRDTQEIRYKQGVEMLNIFKNYTAKTSILDDFMYYEDRQNIMQEEKARLPSKSYDSSLFIPTFVPPSNPNGMFDLPLKADEKFAKHNDPNSLGKTVMPSTDELVPSYPSANNSSDSMKENAKHNLLGDGNDVTSVLKIGSLTINPKQTKAKPFATAAVTVVGAKPVDAVTMGSMPVKVKEFAESSPGIVRVGTIPLEPKLLKLDEAGILP